MGCTEWCSEADVESATNTVFRHWQRKCEVDGATQDGLIAEWLKEDLGGCHQK